MRQMVFYLAADHPTTSGIAFGSAIVGRPEPGADDVRVYFEGGVYGQAEMRTLADRAVYACGRLLEGYPTIAARLVPREALIAVGIFHPATGRIILAGSHSERAVAGWLGASVLDPAELRGEGIRRLGSNEAPITNRDGKSRN